MLVLAVLGSLGWLALGGLWAVYRGLVADYRRLERKCDDLLREAPDGQKATE